MIKKIRVAVRVYTYTFINRYPKEGSAKYRTIVTASPLTPDEIECERDIGEVVTTPQININAYEMRIEDFIKHADEVIAGKEDKENCDMKERKIKAKIRMYKYEFRNNTNPDELIVSRCITSIKPLTATEIERYRMEGERILPAVEHDVTYEMTETSFMVHANNITNDIDTGAIYF